MTASRGSSSRSRGADTLVGASWGNAPYPVLVVDRYGGLVQFNEAARLLWPDASSGDRLHETVPSWLSNAHTRIGDGLHRADSAPSRGCIDDRFFEAHATAVADGDVVWWLIDDTDHRLVEKALHALRARSEVLSEVSSVLLSTLNVPRCMEVTTSMAAQHLAEAAVLVAPAQGRHHPLTHALRGGPVTQGIQQIDPYSLPGLAEALQGFPPVPARWIDPARIPDWIVPAGFTKPLGSVIVSPLPGHGVPAGALILLRSSTEQRFTEGEEVFARLFAARAGAALSAAHLHTEQAAVTAVLMRELLPPALHRVHGVDYAGSYRAAEDHERVGGDFYDVHPGSDPSQETLVVLGDVAGKGLEAAVLTGKIRNTLHALLPLTGDHQRVLELLNGALLSSHHTRFATLVLASVRRCAGTARLRLTSAGHMAPLLIRANGDVEEAATRGTLVGALPSVTTHTTRTVLKPGETCLLYTDGITEARGGPSGDELFGEERLKRALSECAGMLAQAVVERVQMLAAQWLGTGRHDDMAVVAISAPRAGVLSVVTGHAADSDQEEYG
ncbi:PP2C family protein-serine/threonine phosphatase [Streptomyces sp. NPDC012825]|uniref:PP2C family protein-serine/threonine phosphatase n=1 Tax=Streptomyces sp. NPDC012825 TaxID=3364851 RepID=UPI0036BA0DE4